MGKSSAAARAKLTSRSRSDTTWKMRGKHEPHRKIARGAGAGGSDLIQFPRSQIVVESAPPLDIGRDGAPLAEFSREQGGLEWKWKKGVREGARGAEEGGGGRRLDIAVRPARPASSPENEISFRLERHSNWKIHILDVGHHRQRGRVG